VALAKPKASYRRKATKGEKRSIRKKKKIESESEKHQQHRSLINLLRKAGRCEEGLGRKSAAAFLKKNVCRKRRPWRLRLTYRAGTADKAAGEAT
jgi:hypothetical protein